MAFLLDTNVVSELRRPRPHGAVLAWLQSIETWLDQVNATFNILSLDGPAFRCWAQLMHRQSDTLDEDAMIAAIAKVHQLTVVTRNVADFSGFGVPLFDPFTGEGC
jgi:predicted nucleic acid-binding protein